MESFIEVQATHYYPIQNLPYSTGRIQGAAEIHCLSRIGDFGISLTRLEALGFFSHPAKLFDSSTLNKFMAESRDTWISVRSRLQNLLKSDSTELRESPHFNDILIPINQIELTLPVDIGDFTDYAASLNHLTNVGKMLWGPDKALMPHWTRLPIGYHGRSSSVNISTTVRRPRGQVCPPGCEPVFQACEKLDYELEVGLFIGGKTNKIGDMIDVSTAQDNIFGIVLLNDWSARDLQAWENVPLGPLTSKNFSTTISPWIVTLEALAPFKTALPAQNPPPFPYLETQDLFSYDVSLKAFLDTGDGNHLIADTNFKYLHWSLTQQVTHHTVTGCNLRPGDLLGTGTASGPTEESIACLWERSLNGKKPLVLPNGQERSFLHDGDSVLIRGECKGENYTIGLEIPSCTVLPPLRDQYY